MTEFSGYDNREYARPEFKFVDMAVDRYLAENPLRTLPPDIDRVVQQLELDIVAAHPQVIQDRLNLVYWIKKSLETKILYRKKQI